MRSIEKVFRYPFELFDRALGCSSHVRAHMHTRTPTRTHGHTPVHAYGDKHALTKYADTNTQRDLPFPLLMPPHPLFPRLMPARAHCFGRHQRRRGSPRSLLPAAYTCKLSGHLGRQLDSHPLSLTPSWREGCSTCPRPMGPGIRNVNAHMHAYGSLYPLLVPARPAHFGRHQRREDPLARL